MDPHHWQGRAAGYSWTVVKDPEGVGRLQDLFATR